MMSSQADTGGDERERRSGVRGDRRGGGQTESLSNFLVRLGGLLLKYGSSTQRVENVLRKTAVDHGHICEVFAVPTGLWLSLVREVGEQPAVRLIRVYDWAVDLRRLLALDELFNAVSAGTVELSAALIKLEEIDNAAAKYPMPVFLVAEGVACASAALFFGGGYRESLVGGFLGVIGGAVVTLGRRWSGVRLLVEFLVGLLTGAVVWGVSLVNPDLVRRPMILAGIILIVPGMTLTVGLGELAHRHLVSGGARLLHAVMVMMSMILGVAVMLLAEEWSGVASPEGGTAVAHPLWFGAVVALIAGLCFSVLFTVPKGSVLLSAVSCVVAWLGWVLTERYFIPGAMASFSGAVGLGLYANALARFTDRPSQIFLLPGLILLVPGTLGFLGFEEFIKGEAALGTIYLFNTMMNAAALIVGLVLANSLLSPRKLL